MADWMKSREALRIDPSLPADAAIINGIDVDLPNSVNINTSQPWNKLHHFSKDGFNYGVEKKIPSYAFTIEVPSLSESCAYLRAVLTSKIYIDIELKDASGDPAATAEHKTILDKLVKCKITDESLTVNPASVVMVRFVGFALEYQTPTVASGGIKLSTYGHGNYASDTTNKANRALEVRKDASNIDVKNFWPT
jgi:hypothetical protein